MPRPFWLLAAFFAIPLAIGAAGYANKTRFHGTRVNTGNPSPLSTAPACLLPDGGPGGTCRTDYYGGHVISNVKVYVVYWGTNVDTGGGDPGQFFNAVTNSKFLDGLNEYDTNITIDAGTAKGTPGTNQLIGRGTFAGSYTITPSTTGEACPACSSASCGNATCTTCLLDSQINGELQSQISAGNLPRSDPNAIYFIYFPPHTYINSGGTDCTPQASPSCAVGGFCGYHSTYQSDAGLNLGKSVFYAVMPDHTIDCNTGCGASDPAPFNNLTVVSAHELAEAITDSEVGLTGNLINFGPPFGWYDVNNGEIGDMCANIGAIDSIDAGTASFLVQQVYSQITGNCETSRVAETDFSIALGLTSPTSTPHTTLAKGGPPVPVGITLLSTGPSAGKVTVTLAMASSLPTGVTASIDGGPLGADPSLMLNASVTAPAAADVVVAVGGSAADGGPLVVHTASVLVQIVAANDFTVSMTPRSQSVIPGNFVAFNISTAQVAGTGEAAALTVTGLPANVHPTFASSGAASSTLASTNGGSDTLRLAVDSPSTNATVDFTLHVVATSASHTAPGTLFVSNPNDFSLSMTPTGAQTMSSNGTKAFTVTANLVSGAPANIVLGVSGLPSGVTGAFAPTTIQPGGSATLTLTASSAPTSSATIFTVTGMDSDGLSRGTTGSISVTTANDFSISLPSSSISVARNSNATFAVNTAVVSGSPGTITLSATGLPSGVSAGTASVTAGNSGSLTLTASSIATLGSGMSFTVTGMAGSVTHSQTATLSVTGTPGTPTVSVTHPTSGDTVSGNVEVDVTATAAAGSTLQKIDVLVDGTKIGSGATSPAQVFWSSTSGADGAHTITATALDADTGTATSSAVTVTVHNASSHGGCSSSGGAIGALALLGLFALRRKS